MFFIKFNFTSKKRELEERKRDTLNVTDIQHNSPLNSVQTL